MKKLHNLFSHFKKGNIKVKGIPGEEEDEQRVYLKKVIVENFLKLGKELDIQIHETKRTHNYVNTKGPS